MNQVTLVDANVKESLPISRIYSLNRRGIAFSSPIFVLPTFSLSFYLLQNVMSVPVSTHVERVFGTRGMHPCRSTSFILYPALPTLCVLSIIVALTRSISLRTSITCFDF